jgi:hypothetical protein
VSKGTLLACLIAAALATSGLVWANRPAGPLPLQTTADQPVVGRLLAGQINNGADSFAQLHHNRSAVISAETHVREG